MNKVKALQRKLLSVLVILVLLLPSLLTVLLKATPAEAANQMTQRSMKISSSLLSATSVTYTVSFNVATTTSILGIVVDICQNSPLIGLACTLTNGVSSTPTSGTVTVTKNGGGGVNFNVDNTDSTNTGLLILTHGTGMTGLSVGDTISFSFTATNPSGTASTGGAPGTFYGRLLTYATGAAASAYTHLAVGTPIDEGGTAMSTANELTTNARVQEQLTFCVGGTTVDNATTQVASSCASSFTGSGSCGSGNTIDLGVIDNTATNVSPVTTTSGGNTCNGAAMVQTNASNGVTITYFAEPNGTNHTGALRVSGATCSASVVSTDQCFNSSTTQSVFTKGTEDFGVTVGYVNCGTVAAYTCLYSAGTYNMTRNAQYDGDGTNNTGLTDVDRVTTSTTQAGYAWDDSATAGSPQTLATSAASPIKVVDNEALILKFAATASVTTPTGQYSVTSDYVATPVY